MSSYSTSYSSGFSFKHPLKSPRVIDHELLMRLSSHCPRRVSGSVASLRHASFSKVLKPSIVFGFRSSEIEAHRRAVKAVELWVFTKIIAMSLVGDDASLPGSIFGLAKPQIYRILFLSDVTTAILPINEVTEVCVPSKSRHNEAASLSFREWYDALMAVSPRAAWFVARRHHCTMHGGSSCRDRHLSRIGPFPISSMSPFQRHRHACNANLNSHRDKFPTWNITRWLLSPAQLPSRTGFATWSRYTREMVRSLF
jgi:hypothetical protein